jgi:hypothetical protein
MKKTFVLIFQLLLLNFGFSQSLYDLNSIQEIRITFPFTNWDQKLDSLHAVDTDARLIATKVILNGQVYDSVGIRYKGNSTYNAARTKNPFNIKLDYVKSNQNYQSIKTLKLSNGFMDPSFLREVLGYKIARQYLPAASANFINVYVNNELIGLYTNVQDISNDFLSQHYYSSSNAFFQCDRADKPVTLPGSCPPGNPGSALKYLSADSLCYYNAYERDSKSGWSKLIRLMYTLNQDVSNIEKYLDVDRALWMLALNNFYVNLDSYSGSGHNYLVYENNLNRFNTIPWDYNEFFGAFTNAGTGSNLNVQQMIQLDPLLHQSNTDRPLISKLFSNPKYKKRYLAHLYTILADAKISKAYEQDGLALQSLITASVAKDVNKFFTLNAFNTNLYNDFTNSGGMGGKTYPGLISFTNARINFLNTHASLNVVKPEISNVNYSPTLVTNNDNIHITANIKNASFVKLFYRFSKEEVFVEADMFDDGLHMDGSPGDGLFGARFNIGNQSELQYYIYAENASIAALSPAHAEFYSIKVNIQTPAAGEIILNELMASNTNYIKDESGDYDDWIEFYNTTGRDISCKGLYLSDNPDNKLKWKFPDTIIKANSYLIVWADENGMSPGLHANFKLAKAGEQVRMYTSDSVLLDEVIFPALDDNKTYGVCNGSWQHTKSPTFAKANDCNITAMDNSEYLQTISLKPNPFSDILSIELKNTTAKSIQIFNVLSHPVFTMIIPKDQIVKIHTSNWELGLYFAVVEFNNGLREVYKIIKQ